MSDVLVSVENLSKKFCRSLNKSLWYGVQDMAGEMFGRSSERELRPDEFWAVKDVSFELKRGECLGLIGRNGAGKTTLLRMLNGLIKPDHGRIEMRGRIGGLIALGAGFNPILTGRENIYVNASVLGLTKNEIDEKINEIIDFSEIGEFIDMPVQNYSSGMSVRLGFAIATSLSPDILLLDEVLAVGDAAFRDKCYKRIVAIRKNAAVIFVTHNMEQVARICDHALVLAKGESQGKGSVSDGISIYESLNESDKNDDESFISYCHPVKNLTFSSGSMVSESGHDLQLEIRLIAEGSLSDFILRITLYNQSGAFAADCNLISSLNSIAIESGLNIWQLNFPSFPLKKGAYQISINIFDTLGNMIVWSYKQYSIKVTGGYPGAVADCQLQIGGWKQVKY